MQPNKYFAMAFLVFFGFANAIYFLRVLRRNDFTLAQNDRSTPSILVALALCSALIIVVMGWTRETARAANGYLIYGHFALQDEHATYDAPKSGRARED